VKAESWEPSAQNIIFKTMAVSTSDICSLGNLRGWGEGNYNALTAAYIIMHWLQPTFPDYNLINKKFYNLSNKLYIKFVCTNQNFYLVPSWNTCRFKKYFFCNVRTPWLFSVFPPFLGTDPTLLFPKGTQLCKSTALNNIKEN
jgi:hypothetical protein